MDSPLHRTRVGARSFAALWPLWCTLPLAAQTPPAAQTQPSARDSVQIKVSEAAKGPAQLITVPVNQGVLVDFSVPLREVRIANPAIAEAAVTSPKQILVSGRAFGSTQLIVWTAGDEQRVFTVAVDLELERLAASVRQAVPRAQVRATALLDSVVLTGTVPDAESAERVLQIAKVYSPQVINHVRVAGVQQVLLRCTVAEVNRRAIRQLGFNGWIAGDNVPDMFGLSNLDGINPTNIGAAADANVTTQIPFLTGRDGIPVTGGSTISFGFPRVQMQVFVHALRENGLLRVLAEPNLVTVNGQQAEFLAGGEYPIPVPQGGPSNAITIDYKRFGVFLKFTPAVLSENLIRLTVYPEVSEPDYASAVTVSGYVVPGLALRRVQTVVELGSGQTFAIGGLLSERTRAVSRKVPALGDVPVLGALFSSVDYQKNETELVVLVTPELVAPISPDQVAYVPGDDRKDPNDVELFLLGQIDALNPGNPNRSGARNNQNWPVRPDELYGNSASMKLRGPVGPAGSEEGK
jgi:pilus assembly protein CpaC